MSGLARKLNRAAKARIGGFRNRKTPDRLEPAPRGLRTYFDALINRHTGKPHEHRREIARRQRQSAALTA